MDKDNPSVNQIDLLSLIADDKSIVVYRPRWNQLTGSITATVVLQQIIYRWIGNKRQPFYKFTGPCDHFLCRSGDSWQEELGLTRREFATARARIATRTQGDIDPDALVSYWMTTGHCTWYAVNEPLLINKLAALYPADEPAAVGLQLRLPAEPFDKPANAIGGIVERHSTNPQMALNTSANGNGEPFDKSANAIGGIVEQNNKEDLKDDQEQRIAKTTSPPPPPVPDPAPPAAGGDGGVADVPTILRWANFTDRLNDPERATLTPAVALAWAYFIHLEEAKPTRPKNAIGLARSRWRAAVPPPDDLLALARAWLTHPDDGRRALLDRLDFAAKYGLDDDLDDDYPGLPAAAALAVYRATGGQLAPPALMPIRESTRAAIAEARQPATPAAADPSAPSPASTPWPPWKTALDDLENQMTRGTFNAHLRNTTATQTDDALTVHVANAAALDWLTNRLHPLIQRAVAAAAGRPLPVHYEVRP